MYIYAVAFILSLLFGMYRGEAQTPSSKEGEKNIETSVSLAEKGAVSETLGHIVLRNLQAFGLDLDINQVIQGMQNYVAGKEAPMTESACMEAITSAQEQLFEKQSEENLAKAEAFLKENKKETGVISLEEGKIQYKVEKAGAGAQVAENGAPLVHYVGRLLDGTVFDQSSDQPVSLEGAISGIKKAVAGMHEGEKRLVYIHPDFAYGATGSYFFPPNSLLTFEVEVVKASSPAPDIAAKDPSVKELFEQELSSETATSKQ